MAIGSSGTNPFSQALGRTLSNAALGPEVRAMAAALLVGVLLMFAGLMTLGLGFATAYAEARKGWTR